MNESQAPPLLAHDRPPGPGAASPLRMIAGLARAVAQARTDPQAIAEIAARTLVQELADGCVVRLAARFQVRAFAHRDLAAEEFLRDALPSVPIGRLPAGDVLATGRPLLLARVPPEYVDTLCPEARAYVRVFSLRSLLAVPVRCGAAVVGAITAWRDRAEDPFGEDDVNALHVCSEHVGLALEHADAFQALRVREARFELAARATEDVLWDWDLATGAITWNEAVRTTLRWPEDQVDGSLDWWTAHVHDDDRERVLAGLDRAIRDNPAGVRWQDEYRFRRGDGSFARIVDRGYVLRVDGGRPVRFVGSMQDISDRVEITRRLAEREESYRAFIATSSEGIWCFAGDPGVPIDLPPDAQIAAFYARATLVECNDVTARMYGYERADQLLGAPLAQFLPPDDPRSQSLLRGFIAHGYRLVDGESTERDRHGRERLLLNNIVGVVVDGRLVRAWGTQRDLTELRRREADEGRTRALLTAVCDATPDLVFARDQAGALLFANPAARRALAREHAPSAEDRRVLATGETLMLEETYPDGRVYLSTRSPFRDPAGRVLGVVGTATDITERKRAEQALRESQQLFSRAFGKNPNAMSLNALPACEFIDVNEALVRATGLSREQLLGRTPFELGIFLDPDDPPRLAAALRRTGSVRDAELRLRGAGGEIHTVVWSAEILEYQGRRCVLTAATNITDRKRAEEALHDSEERFRQIADNIEQVFWLTEFHPTERIAYVSPACVRAWGRTPAELQADARVWLAAIHPDDRPVVEQGFVAWLTDGADTWEHEYRIVHPDGRTVRWIHDRGALIRDARGRPWRAAGIAEDITERRLAEHERERLVADLRAAVAVRDDFLALASHELRTPLAALDFHLEHLARLVARHPADPRALADKVAGAVRQVDRLTGLVDSLLDVGQMSPGRLRLDLADTDLAALVRDLAARLDDDARRAGCQLRVDAPPALPGRWDRRRLDQALGHMLANALKYGAGHPVDLRLRADARAAVLEIEDHGIGIAEADVRRIFARFERAVPSTHYGGFGLGLYIANRIVEAHGGAIDVTSRPGQGATFRVRLPLDPAQHQPEA